jgi:peptidoglycan L-alanyl-D-glutamate endopeptidase CwlK
MRDEKSVERLATVHPSLRNEVLEIYADIAEALSGKAICRIAHGIRSFAEQDALFAQGRTKGGKIVTNAKGGESYHNYGLAVDIVLLKDTDGNGTFDTASWETNVDFDGDGMADWQEIVKVFKMYGWEAGIDWKFRDAPHFQKTFGKSIKELQSAWLVKKFIPGTNYVQLG